MLTTHPQVGAYPEAADRGQPAAMSGGERLSSQSAWMQSQHTPWETPVARLGVVFAGSCRRPLAGASTGPTAPVRRTGASAMLSAAGG
jgi:hypothetical protein